VQISVIIPTYNRTNDLERCLRSVLAQSISPTEVIVIDNGYIYETRKTVEKMESLFSSRGIKLKYIKNNENSLTVAKNIGILQSSGDIISFLDDDLILDSNYYREVTKVYETIPNALGVAGYIEHRQVKRGIASKILDAYKRIFFISIKGDSKFRVLPSLGNTYSDRSGVISCEWLSGASTYKRNILKIVKPDENLKKYCWNEDLDLSYRIYKRQPGTLFILTNAKYFHSVSPIGRNPKKELFYMVEVYGLYFFYKNIKQSLKNKAIYAWCRLGKAFLNCLILLFGARTRTEDKRLIFHAVYAPLYSIMHLKNIIRQNLDFFNKSLLGIS
jgi:glycosyltransferase involved in cell wall biosynthesis